MNCEFCQGDCQPLYPVTRGTLVSTMHRCAACLSACVHPPFPPESLNDFYENSYFQAAPWEVNKSAVLAGDYFRKVQPYLSHGPANKSLDVGAGFGHFARYYAEKTGTGIDIAEPSASCRQVISGQKSVGQVFQSLGDVSNTSTYDQVFCFHVVEHLQEFTAFAGELHRRLNARGRVFILTPNGGSSNFLELGRAWAWTCPEQHYQFLSHRIPAEYYAKIGFDVVAAQALGPAVIHYPGRWFGRVHRVMTGLDSRIETSQGMGRFIRKCVRKLLRPVAKALQPNLTNHNLILLEKFLAGLNRTKSQDELLLVLQKRSGDAPSSTQNRPVMP